MNWPRTRPWIVGLLAGVAVLATLVVQRVLPGLLAWEPEAEVIQFSAPIVDVSFDREGDAIWVLTSDGFQTLLFRRDAYTGEQRHWTLPVDLKGGGELRLKVESAYVWIGGPRGVVRFDPASGDFLSTGDGDGGLDLGRDVGAFLPRGMTALVMTDDDSHLRWFDFAFTEVGDAVIAPEGGAIMDLAFVSDADGSRGLYVLTERIADPFDVPPVGYIDKVLSLSGGDRFQAVDETLIVARGPSAGLQVRPEIAADNVLADGGADTVAAIDPHGGITRFDPGTGLVERVVEGSVVASFPLALTGVTLPQVSGLVTDDHGTTWLSLSGGAELVRVSLYEEPPGPALDCDELFIISLSSADCAALVQLALRALPANHPTIRLVELGQVGFCPGAMSCPAPNLKLSGIESLFDPDFAASVGFAFNGDAPSVVINVIREPGGQLAVDVWCVEGDERCP